MSQLVAKTENQKTIAQWLTSTNYVSQLQAAVPRDVDASRIARIVLTAVRTSSSLAQCDRTSILGAGMICAQTGLEPGPIGHAAIVPYKRKAQFQAMYKGLLHLCYRSGKVSSVQAGVVYEADHFDYDEGSKPHVSFKRSLEADRGQRVAVYATINPHEGPPLVRVFGWHEIERIRKQYSKTTRDDSAWVTETDEMACKTGLKRVLKLAPISVEAGLAVGFDDAADLGRDQVVTAATDQRGLTPERSQKSYCNKDLGSSGLVCGLDPEHTGECTP